MKTHLSNPGSGFTLIETLVAVAVLTLAIIGPFTALQSAITASYAARDQLAATALAQEAIEYVRGVRDANFLHLIGSPGASRTWLDGLNGTSGPDCVTESGATLRCTVSPFSATEVAQCALSGTGTCSPLNLSSSGLYTQDTGTPTRFTRYILMRPVSVSDSIEEIEVTAVVEFTSARKPYSVRIQTMLYNWL